MCVCVWERGRERVWLTSARKAMMCMSKWWAEVSKTNTLLPLLIISPFPCVCFLHTHAPHMHMNTHTHTLHIDIYILVFHSTFHLVTCGWVEQLGSLHQPYISVLVSVSRIQYSNPGIERNSIHCLTVAGYIIVVVVGKKYPVGTFELSVVITSGGNPSCRLQFKVQHPVFYEGAVAPTPE